VQHLTWLSDVANQLAWHHLMWQPILNVANYDPMRNSMI
jgi:hypothetical protein